MFFFSEDSRRLKRIENAVNVIYRNLDELTMKLSEALAAIAQVKAQLIKAKDEILAKISALESTDPDISPEGQENISGLKAIAEALDGIVPDATEPPTPEA